MLVKPIDVIIVAVSFKWRFKMPINENYKKQKENKTKERKPLPKSSIISKRKEIFEQNIMNYLNHIY